MPVPQIPLATLRSLGFMLRLAILFVRSRAGDIVAGLLDRGRPPSDLVVSTSSGGRYSGVLVLDEGRVLGGVVRLAGSEPRVPPSRPQVTSPTSSLDPYARHDPPRSSSLFGDRLRDDDDDDLDGGDEPWRRR